MCPSPSSLQFLQFCYTPIPIHILYTDICVRPLSHKHAPHLNRDLRFNIIVLERLRWNIADHVEAVGVVGANHMKLRVNSSNRRPDLMSSQDKRCRDKAWCGTLYRALSCGVAAN
jgi:hypothetical protein